MINYEDVEISITSLETLYRFKITNYSLKKKIYVPDFRYNQLIVKNIRQYV
jgi:hypothetical protein